MERLVNIFFLHGFLGRPQDWAPVQNALNRQDKVIIRTPDYFRIEKLSPSQTFTDWAKNFNKWVEQETAGRGQNIIVGYSMGARLALHALDHNQSLWSKAVLISANPGFDDDHEVFTDSSEERRLRWINDSFWAEEFLIGEWDTTIRNWNSQTIFGGGRTEPERDEAHYSRDMLSLALTQWSLAQQKNMRQAISKNAPKISWLVGERDEKFVDLSKRLREEIANLKVEIISEASHRVIFDRPVEIAERIRNLLQQAL